MVKPWSRVASSRTGRPTRCAARATIAMRCVNDPREPKPPPA